MTTLCLVDIGTDYLNKPAFMRDLERSSRLPRAASHPIPHGAHDVDELACGVAMTPVRFQIGAAGPLPTNKEKTDA